MHRIPHKILDRINYNSITEICEIKFHYIFFFPGLEIALSKCYGLFITLKMAHQCDHANAPLPLPPIITCRIHHPDLFRDLEIYKSSTGFIYILAGHFIRYTCSIAWKHKLIISQSHGSNSMHLGILKW